MSSEQELLTNEDRANGFAMVVDDRHNITLSKWGKPFVWFSAAVCGEVMRALLELMRSREKEAQARKSEVCPKLDDCYKVQMVLDKDWLDFQYAEAIRSVCADCPEAQKAKRLKEVSGGGAKRASQEGG